MDSEGDQPITGQILNRARIEILLDRAEGCRAAAELVSGDLARRALLLIAEECDSLRLSLEGAVAANQSIPEAARNQADAQR